MLDLTFSIISRRCANAANFVRWQVWLSTIILCLSSIPATAADDIYVVGDTASISNAEIGSYVVRDGVAILVIFTNGHAGLASGIDNAGNHLVLDIEGQGDVVAERSFTAFRTTGSTGTVNHLMGVGHPKILDTMTPLEKQMYRSEVRNQAAKAVGHPYVTTSPKHSLIGITYLWINPPGVPDEITHVVNGIPQLADTYRCDGLMEWSYEAALAVIRPAVVTGGYVNPTQGAYTSNNGNIANFFIQGVAPSMLYAPASGYTSVNPTVADYPDWTASMAPPALGNGTYSISWTAPYDASGIRTYGYAWIPQASLNSSSLSITTTTATSVSNQLLPTVAGVYYFVVYAQDNMGHWSTQNGRYQSAAYTVTPVNGVCGTSNGGSFAFMPTANLCSSGTQATVIGSGPWFWSCNGSNGGTAASCSASLASQPQTIGTISIYPTILTVGGVTSVSAISSSGLPVSYSSLTPSLCTINGSTVTGIASGTCTVAANQSGNTSYSAAPQVTQYIFIGRNSQSIGTINFSSPTLLLNNSTTVSATDSSGLAVSYSSNTPTICSVSGNTITAIAAGACIVAADQAGNAYYSAAPQMTQSIISSTVSRSDCLFNWAEKTYPQYFSTVGAADATYAPFSYRYYTGTGNYLAISSADNNVYVMGSSFGGFVPVVVGAVTSFLGVSGCP